MIQWIRTSRLSIKNLSLWKVPDDGGREAAERGQEAQVSTLETTQGQNDSFFSQLTYKCYQNRVASVGD